MGRRKTTATISWTGKEETVKVGTVKTESDFWKPIGEYIAKADIAAPDIVSVFYNGMTTEIRVEESEDGKRVFHGAHNGIDLPRVRYGVKKLRRIDPDTGSHCFYDIVPNNMGDVTIDVGARYGQTGVTNAGGDMVENAYVLKPPFAPYLYWLKYFTLLGEGYEDLTDMVFDSDEAEEEIRSLFQSEDAPEDDTEKDAALHLYEKLQMAAKMSLQSKAEVNFLSSKPPVSRRQLESAKKLLAKMRAAESTEALNDAVKKMLGVIDIPFKTKDGKKRAVADFMAKKVEDKEKQDAILAEIVAYWTDVIQELDFLVPQLQTKTKAKKVSPFGSIKVEYGSDEDLAKWKEQFHAPGNLFYKYYSIEDEEKQERFEKYVKDNKVTDIRHFVHGSRTENWGSIIINGLVLYPNAVISGKAYGYGIYTARDFVKSMGYTSYYGSKWAGGSSSVGYIAVVKTAYGKPLLKNALGDYTSEVKKGGYGCLDAHRGSNGFAMDEIVFYDEKALLIVGLIAYSDDEAAL